MARILILLAVVLGVFWWLRARAEARLAEQRARQARNAGQRPAAGPAGDAAEPMVQCAHCGVHLPQGEAIAWRGLHYCRRSHLPDESRAEGANGNGSGGARP
ncbi:PP0621 family protein [Cupriavidus sp. TMH.W2]|uniref:PP0621 family protein n=1 Tax=Cupriavidus sp. TMH.W2 TaxID=3434465 RepID=UPI003D781951